MTKRLSHERLEEIRELNEKLAEMYGDSSGDRPVIRQLLAHIDALEEALADTTKLLNIAHHNWRLEKRNDTE